MFKTIAIILILGLSQINAATTDPYNYNTSQGGDWTSMGQCNGSKQSPIDLPTWTSAGCDTATKVKVEFPTSAMSSVPLEYPTGQTGGKKTMQSPGLWDTFLANPLGSASSEFSYAAQQFHIHARSEHTVAGTRYDAELHIVHTLNNQLPSGYTYTHAVLGLLFEVDSTLTSAQEAETIFGKWGVSNFSTTTTTLSNLTPSQLFSQVDLSQGLWHYEGGLTTPPCSEVVNWFISKKIYKISQAQYDAIFNVFKADNNINSTLGNYRAVQPLGSRTVKQVCANQDTAAWTYQAPPAPQVKAANSVILSISLVALLLVSLLF